uniref:Uncharacterized protein n=1 Tax=Parascaris univalens TaxID=6257 RepID=A0A915AKU7_PARUN
MARHKAVAKTSEGAKRGRPGKGTGAAEENGIEKATPKVAPAVAKQKGKRGRPAGSTKKDKKGGDNAKKVQNTTRKEKESERRVVEAEESQQCARSSSEGRQKDGQP